MQQARSCKACSFLVSERAGAKKGCEKALHHGTIHAKIGEIKDNCELHSVPTTEFVVQTGQGRFYIFAPKNSDLFITCESLEATGTGVGDSMKEKYSTLLKGALS